MKSEALTDTQLQEFEGLLRIDTHRDDDADPQRIKVHESLNEAGEYVQNLLSDLPFNWERIQKDESADFFIGRTQEIDPEKPAVILSGHLDVVPNYSDPEIEDGFLYAPGAEDMKGGIYVMVETVRRLHEQGMCQNLILALNPEEEIGNPNHGETMQELAEEGDYVMVFESSNEDVDSGVTKIVKSRKGAWVYEIDIERDQSVPSQDLYLRTLKLIEKLNEGVDYDKGTTINLGVLREVEGERDTDPDVDIKDNHRAIRIEMKGPEGHSGNLDTPETRHSTLNMMTRLLLDLEEAGELKILSLSGGTKVNVIPGKSEGVIYLRDKDIQTVQELALRTTEGHEDAVEIVVEEVDKPDTSNNAVGTKIVGEYRYKSSQEDGRLRNLFEEVTQSLAGNGIRIKLNEIGKFPALEESNNSRLFMDMIAQVAEEQGLDVVFEDRAGASDANHFSGGNKEAGVLDGFGPKGSGNHTTQERVDLSSIPQSIDFAHQLIEGLMTD